MGRNLGELCPLLWGGELGLHVAECGLAWGLPPYQVASWSMQPFWHNRHRPKIGGSAPFMGRELSSQLTQCRLCQGLPSYQVASWSIEPFGHNRYGLKIWGAVPLWRRGPRSPSNTMWPGPRPTSMPTFIRIRPTVWPQYTNVTDRTDRQTDNGPIA